jgi:hypothetical protein
MVNSVRNAVSKEEPFLGLTRPGPGQPGLAGEGTPRGGRRSADISRARDLDRDPAPRGSVVAKIPGFMRSYQSFEAKRNRR